MNFIGPLLCACPVEHRRFLNRLHVVVKIFGFNDLPSLARR